MIDFEFSSNEKYLKNGSDTFLIKLDKITGFDYRSKSYINDVTKKWITYYKIIIYVGSRKVDFWKDFYDSKEMEETIERLTQIVD